MDPDASTVHVRSRCVAVCIAHNAMRAFIVELVDRERGCWSAIAVPDLAALPAVLAGAPVHLLVVDGANFPACCRDRLGGFPRDQVVVIGAEADDAYQAAAFAAGAGAWMPRDRVGQDLTAALRQVLAGNDARDTPNTL